MQKNKLISLITLLTKRFVVPTKVKLSKVQRTCKETIRFRIDNVYRLEIFDLEMLLHGLNL